MNRRGFLSTLIGGVAASAAVRTWPFRVFSFPAQIVLPPLVDSTVPATVMQTRVIRGMLDPKNMAVLEAMRKRLPEMFEPYDVRAFAFNHEKYQREHVFGEISVTVMEPERRPIRVR